jgi:hypothetical protein
VLLPDELQRHAFALELAMQRRPVGLRPPRLDLGQHRRGRIASSCTARVAVFSEPFLSMVLVGRKTVESRFSQVRCAPFGQVEQGDIILIKRVAGPICGLALARRAWFYDLLHEPIDRIRATYGHTICADDVFWEKRRRSSYATLIELGETTDLEPLSCTKRDRRGWVSLRSRQLSLF